MNNTDKASPAEVAFAANRISPVLEHAETHHCELHFGWIAVVHANQRGRAPASPLANVALVNDYNLSRLPLREVEGNGRAHDAGAENYDVGGCGLGIWFWDRNQMSSKAETIH
jgi:hypothetical protein